MGVEVIPDYIFNIFDNNMDIRDGISMVVKDMIRFIQYHF